MGFSTLQDWIGSWKELKNWVLHRSDTIPEGIVEGGFYYDNTGKKPMYYDGLEAKPMGASDHNDLDGIDGGDATFKGHTTSEQAGYINNAGAANGVALLDSNGYLPIGNIPASLLGAVRYQGTWNPSTNTPTLVTPPSADTKGHYYVASAVGAWDGKTFAIGDWIISNGSAWERVDNVDAITTVFGRTGAVTAQSGDYTAAQVANTPTGNISATTVQAALNELDSEKLNVTTASSTYVTNTTAAKLTLATCTTAQATAAKVVTLANYTLTQGDIIEVLMTNAAAASSTLNVNGTGAKNIYEKGAATNTSSWAAGNIVGFVYDGAYWHILWTKPGSSASTITDKTLAQYVNVAEHSTNNTNYPLVWENGSQALFKTASKANFNPSTGLLQATKIGVIGGTSSGFLKADGSVDSTDYQEQLTFDYVPTDGSSNPVTSNGVYDGLASKVARNPGETDWVSFYNGSGTVYYFDGIANVQMPMSTSLTSACVARFEIVSSEAATAADQWRCVVEIRCKNQYGTPTWYTQIVEGDPTSYANMRWRRDQNAEYMWFTIVPTYLPWTNLSIRCLGVWGGGCTINMESTTNNVSTTYSSHCQRWNSYNPYFRENTGAYAGLELQNAVKNNYAGLSVPGLHRMTLMSHTSEHYNGIYNDTDSKWIVCRHGSRNTLFTHYPPPASSDNDDIATTEWVKDIAPQLGSGFSAGTKMWYGPASSKAVDGNTLYFCY